MPKFFDRVKFLMVFVVCFALMTLPKLALAGGPDYEEDPINFDIFFSGLAFLFGGLMLLASPIMWKKGIIKAFGRFFSALGFLAIAWMNLLVPGDMEYLYLGIIMGWIACFVMYIGCLPDVPEETQEEEKTSNNFQANSQVEFKQK